MYETPRQFIETIGGYKAVAPRLGIGATTLHTHMTKQKLPAKLFVACCGLATESGAAPPPLSLFSFVELMRLPQPEPVGRSVAA